MRKGLTVSGVYRQLVICDNRNRSLGRESCELWPGMVKTTAAIAITVAIAVEEEERKERRKKDL